MNIKKILPHILVIILVFFTDDTLLFGTNSSQIFIILKFVVYIILLFIGFLKLAKIGKKRSFVKGISVFAVLACLVLLSSLYNSDLRTGNLLALLTLLTAVLYVQFIDFFQFKKIYLNVIYFLAICSLIIYVINIFFPSFTNLFPVISNYGDVRFNTLLISNVFEGTNQFRNTSIFREPGVYAIYLNIALIFLLFLEKSISKKKLIVFGLALLSTLSTAGIIVSFLIILLYFSTKRSFKNLFISIFFGVAVFGVFTFFPGIYESLFAKLNSSNQDYLSSLARIASFILPLEIIKESPIFGVGLTNFVYFYESYSFDLVGVLLKADSTSTNTFLNSFAIFGIIYGFIIVRLYYNFCKLIVNRYAIFLLIIMFVLFSSQDLRYSFLYLVLLSYGIVWNFQKENKL